MPDLSVTHQEPPREETERPYSRVIEELLKYHIRWWGDSRLEAWPFYQRAGGPLRMAQAIRPEDVRKSCADFEKAFREFAKEENEFEPSWVETMERIIDRYPDAFLSRVEGGEHVTLLHGDAHLWNFYFPKDPATSDLILFDWETYKRGLGAYDLAYLLVHGTSGRETLEPTLMHLYYQKLIEGGVEGYTRDQFEYDYRLSIVSTTFCPLIWKRVFSMRSAMQAFADWNCDEHLR